MMASANEIRVNAITVSGVTDDAELTDGRIEQHVKREAV